MGKDDDDDDVLVGRLLRPGPLPGTFTPIPEACGPGHLPEPEEVERVTSIYYEGD